MLSPEARSIADRYWARFFGIPPERLRPAEPLVVAHAAELADYAGSFLQGFDRAAPIISLPPSMIDSHADSVVEAARGGVGDGGRWTEVFGSAFGRAIGPAAVRYVDRESLRALPASDSVRLLGPEDAEAVDALRRACTETEWEHSGSGFGEHPGAGVFVDGVLAARAGYEVWDGTIAHVGIVTHPAHRGRGLGAAAVSRITAEALDRGLLPQYRALESNTASIAIAARLGFVPYARSLAVRLSI